MARTKTTTTTIKPDGTTTTTTNKPRKKKQPPQIGEGPYDDYKQGVHMMSYHIHNLLTKEATVIEEFLKFYPKGEYNQKIEAIRKVFLETICFTGKLMNWVITGANNDEVKNPAEEGIDF